jgi:hypothetical protein
VFYGWKHRQAPYLKYLFRIVITYPSIDLPMLEGESLRLPVVQTMPLNNAKDILPVDCNDAILQSWVSS